MSQLTLIPLVKSEKKSRWWAVYAGVKIEDPDLSYIIPAGFISNFASMPAFLFPLVPPHGHSAIPSVKHDYRYIHLIGVKQHGFWKARRMADLVYRQDLIAAGCSRFQAYAMYYAVRAFGWWYWLRHARTRLETPTP